MGTDFRYTSVVLDSGSFGTDLAVNHATPKEMPGIERAVMTPFGPSWVRYGKATQTGGATRGQLTRYKQNVTMDNILSGSTTTCVTTGLTAGAFDGDVLVCFDDAGGAGASPEGYAAPIISNTTTTVYIDPNNPFPVATALNDDFRVVSFAKNEASAAGNERCDLFGIAAATITQDYWGWFFFNGVCPYALVKANTAMTASKALIADTSRLTVSSTSGQELLAGHVLGKLAVASDIVDDACAVKLYNLGAAHSVSA